jgi:hypothetical protein
VDECVNVLCVENVCVLQSVSGHAIVLNTGPMTHDGARILRDWLDQHLPEHPAVPADAFDDMETAL